jgi:hypothetical protein
MKAIHARVRPEPAYYFIRPLGAVADHVLRVVVKPWTMLTFATDEVARNRVMPLPSC